MASDLDKLKNIRHSTERIYAERPVMARQKFLFSKIALGSYLLVSIVGVIGSFAANLSLPNPAEESWNGLAFLAAGWGVGLIACIFNLKDKIELAKVAEFYEDVDIVVNFLERYSSANLNKEELAIKLLSSEAVHCPELGKGIYLSLRKGTNGNVLHNTQVIETKTEKVV